MIVFGVKIHYANEPITRADVTYHADVTYTVTADDDVKARGRALYLENKRMKGEPVNTRPAIRFCEITALVELSE